MHRRRLLVAVAVVLVAGAGSLPARLAAGGDTLPERLTNEQFWQLIEDFSEPNGYFRSDNLLSNELSYPYVIPDLVRRARPAGVYLGVGPEQNFHYIAALRPRMAFITDIRRGNLHAQLMYKALFELSADRADFVSRLFTKKRPAGLTAESTAAELISAFWDVVTSDDATYKQNLKAIQDHLTKTRALPLGAEDLSGIEYVYWHFYWYGFLLNYNSSSNNAGIGRGGGSMVNYGDLMVAADAAGVVRSYLASEESFRTLKALEERNLLVPVVGNFGGPKALRAVGQYVRDHGATVTAFYLSNVEQYLSQDGLYRTFCANVASMPLDDASTFIRWSQGGGGGRGGGLISSLSPMKAETQGCAGGGSQAVAPGVRTGR
jgi:hypothetical protein